RHIRSINSFIALTEVRGPEAAPCIRHGLRWYVVGEADIVSPTRDQSNAQLERWRRSPRVGGEHERAHPRVPRRTCCTSASGQASDQRRPVGGVTVSTHFWNTSEGFLPAIDMLATCRAPSGVFRKSTIACCGDPPRL